MGTIKKFIKYFLIFIIVFLTIGVLTNIAMGEEYRILSNYKTIGTSPLITIKEIKTTYSHVYINGTVTNNTGKYLPLRYLQIDLYGKDDVYLGSEFKELKYFNINETISFNVDYEYINVDKIIVGVKDEIKNFEKKTSTKGKIKVNPIVTEETIQLAIPIAGAMLFWYVLPY